MKEALDKRRYEGKTIVGETFNGLYREEDVREAIKELKEEIGAYDEINSDDVFEIINKIFGTLADENYSPLNNGTRAQSGVGLTKIKDDDKTYYDCDGNSSDDEVGK